MKINDIQSTFQLIGTAIRKLEVNNNYVGYNDNSVEYRDLDVSYKILEVGEGEEKDELIGTLLLEIDVNVGENDKCMHILLAMEGGFYSEKMEEEKFRDMLELNGCASLYSIARAMILNISSQTCEGGNLILPMINTFKLKEKNNTV